MTDLSQRIMDAWLAVNPEPDRAFTNRDVFIPWLKQKDQLKAMLDCGAYESAVIQFLVPEGWEWEIENHGFAVVFNRQGREVHGNANAPAEALLNAILAAREA